MALCHCQSTQAYELMDSATSSLPSTPVPSTYGGAFMSTSQHTFSSPLAECYAGDGELGASSNCFQRLDPDMNLMRGTSPPSTSSSTDHQKSRAYPRSFLDPSPLNQALTSNRREKPPGNFGLGIEEGHSSNSGEALLREPKHGPLEGRPSASATKHPYEATRKPKQKSLLSPIMLTPPTVPRETSDSTGDSAYDLGSANMPSMRPPLFAANENRCAFPSYEEHSAPSTKVGASEEALPCSHRDDNPLRPWSVSLGEERANSILRQEGKILGSNAPPLSHRLATVESKEPRRSAGSLSLKTDCRPWVDQIVQATKRAGSYQPNASFNGHSSTSRNRPRLWLNATKEEQGIAEAVKFCLRLPSTPLLTISQHITTLTPSPTKPRVISIARKDSPISPSGKYIFPATGTRQQLSSSNKPATPPATPSGSIDPGMSLHKPYCFDEKTESLMRKTSPVGYPYTPPNSRISTPRERSAIRHVTTVPSTVSKPQDPTSSACYSSPCNDRVDQTMSELEAAVYNHPSARLYLDSPVVEYIRLLSTVKRSSVHTPDGCKTPFSAAPHSRYSVFRPLTSHPITPQVTPSYRAVQHDRTAETAKSSNSQSVPHRPAESSVENSNLTLSALRLIFPQAPAALLESLQASYLALNYMVSLPTTPASSTSEQLSTPCPSPSLRSFSSIPPKARATLGIQTSLPVTARTSWLNLTSPQSHDERRAFSVKGERAKLQERRENLQSSLRILVRGLLGEIEGRRLTKRDESLVRAIGEVVKCGENVCSSL